MAVNLLERDQELAALHVLLDQIAVVSGEAGIGKTALVERFLAQMGRQPSERTQWAACEALFTPRPLGPLYDIAQQAASALRALPEWYGPWQMCADRLSRWRRHAILHP